MRKRVSQDWNICKKFAAKRWSQGMPTLPSSESTRLLSPRVPAMKKILWSPAHYGPSQSERSPKHSVTLMQQEEDPTQLGQRINQLILNGCDPQTLPTQIVQMLGEAFQVDCCLMMLEQEDVTKIGCWYADASAQGQQHQREEHLAMMPTAADFTVIDDINTVATSSVKEWQHLLPPYSRAILQIPIPVQGKLNGVVSLIKFTPYHWSESETKRAKTIASSVAIAISHIFQTKLLASLQQQVRTSAQSKNLLNQLTTANRSSLELDQFLQMAIAGVAKALEVDRGLVLLLKYADPLLKSRSRNKIPKAKASVVCEWSQDANSQECENQNQTSTLSDRSFLISECLLCQQALTNSPLSLIHI